MAMRRLREVDQLKQWLKEQRRDVCMERALANWSQLQVCHSGGIPVTSQAMPCSSTL